MKNGKQLVGIAILLIVSLLSGRENGAFDTAVSIPQGAAASCGNCAALRPCKETSGLLAESLFTSTPQPIRLLQQNPGNGNSYGKRNQPAVQLGTGVSASGRNRQNAPFHPIRHPNPAPFGIYWLEVFRI